MPADFDEMQRRAMGILSDASQKVMGKVSLVYQTIKNAYETGDLVDYLTASSVFNALPGNKRNQIGHTAYEQARDVIGKPVEGVPAQLPEPVRLVPVIDRATPARPQQPPRLIPEKPAAPPVDPKWEPLVARTEAPTPPTVVPLERPQPAARPAPAPIPEEKRPAAASNVVEITPAPSRAPVEPVVAPIETPRLPAVARAADKPSTEKVWSTGAGPTNVAPLAPLNSARGKQSAAPARPEPNRTPRPGGS